ncbi:MULTISPECIES: hypothetical protein [Enterococcus]|uniref:Uncharacterized protein n=2 Tax=Enterococcus TaxID=1350 RepID=A0ABZ2SW07_9ENTE|nr:MULTISPECIES: hypothetical protein [unclassified Enterococcus]MBO0489081.1 hypothetical protein [Enterococcus sp. DIV1094]
MPLYNELLEEQKRKYKEIDLNRVDLEGSISYFREELRNATQTDRMYSQENIKRKLTAERELSEIQSLKQDLDTKRSLMVNETSKRLGNKLRSQAFKEIYTVFQEDIEEPLMEEVEELISRLNEILEVQERSYQDFKEDAIRKVILFEPYLTHDTIDFVVNGIRYSNNSFKMSVTDKIKKKVSF